MLWYKAWLETRARFLILLCVMLANSVGIIRGLAGRAQTLSWPYFVLQRAHQGLAMLWVLAVTLLMMGGLLREVAVGASDFTLALPVSRARLMRVRIAMGFLQATTLAVLPWTVMFLITRAMGKGDSLGNAAFHLLLLAGGGTVFVAFALLVSTVIAGEYTAPAVALGTVLIVSMALGDPPLNAYSPMSLLIGESFMDHRTLMLTGPVPWLRLGITVLAAMLMAIAAARVVEKKEF